TGANDTLDVNFDMTSNVLTAQNFASVDLGAGVDLLANNGAIDLGSTNIAGITLSGGNGTAGTIDSNGDAGGTLSGISDTNNPNLTVTSDGNVNVYGLNNLGTGLYSFTADNDDDGTATLTLLGTVTGNAAILFSAGGTGTNDSLSILADMTAGS